MRNYLLVLLLLLCLPSLGQTHLYLQKVSDSTRQRPLKLNKNYGVVSKDKQYKRGKLTATSDSVLVFTLRGKTKEILQVPIKELRFIDTTPALVNHLAETGKMLLILAQIPLIASPFIGLLDDWQKAGKAAAFSGTLAGGGLLLVSPLFLAKIYNLEKEWRIIKINH